MKREYTKLFSFILGVTFILSGVIFTFVNSYKIEKENKIKEEKAIIDEILKVYKDFKNKEEKYNTMRNDVTTKISEYTSYYSDMEAEYDETIVLLNEYETVVKEVEDSSSYLKTHCINEIYSSHDANSKCNAYIINFEKTVNSFIGDIEFFNSKINEYNEWIIEENKELKEKDQYTELLKFEPKYYKTYLDINNDGTCLGRNSD